VHRPWTGRKLRNIHDPRRMSRWAVQTYRLCGDKTLSVITAYHPCRLSPTTGEQPLTINHQQQTPIFDNTGKRLEPRQVFIDDIITLITTLQKDPNHHGILMLDENESIDDRSGALRKLMSSTSLVDTFSHISNSQYNIPTYTRGSKRIDYILTSQNLLPYVKRT
jgi:hypothetical protein